MKAYLNTRPNELQSEQIDLSNIGWRLVEKNQAKYIGKEAAAWDMTLQPRPNHFDKRITVQTPLKAAGAYLLVGIMQGGNVSRILVWLSDTVIVRKQLKDAVYTYVADAATGQPIPNIKVDFFGYRQQWIKDNKYRLDIQQFPATADADGQVIIPTTPNASDKAPPPVDPAAPDHPARLQLGHHRDRPRWRRPLGFAFIGFNSIWFQSYYDEYDNQYNRTKAYIVTDRPVYRPGDKVQWKMWLGSNKYDEDAPRGQNKFAGQHATMQIQSPKGDILKTLSGTLDEWGGLSGEYLVEKEATLGSYNISDAAGWGGIAFRVEEYKKPEFEVKIDAPTDPIMLGEKITATISAKYYFGATRYSCQSKIQDHATHPTMHAGIPRAKWDWFYEPGYWWFACDYNWYPGWRRWGCLRPMHLVARPVDRTATGSRQ